MFNHVEAVPTPLTVVTLAGHHFALRLAPLLLENLLLTSNPPQARNHREADSLVGETQRCCDTNPAFWRVDAHVEVLDVLADNLHGHAPNFNSVSFSNHAGSLRSCISHPQPRRR